VLRPAPQPTPYGVIYYGSTSLVINEALELLAGDGDQLDQLRVRAFPFHRDVADFIANHHLVFVIEQNRDGQLRTLIVSECGIDPARLVPVLHFDGTPITARFVANAIADHLGALKVKPLRKVMS
jgi:2-oxoglutarate/2-oxoacid ferredoxin oxidoreductase subunit alpha